MSLLERKYRSLAMVATFRLLLPSAILSASWHVTPSRQQLIILNAQTKRIRLSASRGELYNGCRYLPKRAVQLLRPLYWVKHRVIRLCAMSALKYDVLRTSKAALDEGLIDQGDYDAVKRSFLRAQQIKAGLDAGFIPEAEYTHVKRTFLESLNIGIASPDGPASINDTPGRASNTYTSYLLPAEGVPGERRVLTGIPCSACKDAVWPNKGT